MCPHVKFGIPISNNMSYALDTIFLDLSPEVRTKATDINPKRIHDNPQPKDALTHEFGDSYLKLYRRYALDTMWTI